MENYAPDTPIDPRVEMFQKGQPMDAFFNMKALAPRPMSTATEMFDTDFEDSDEEIEEANSPRISVNSSGRRSERTLSSFEEVQTPAADVEFEGYNFRIETKPAVEGPRGPHLFRSSVASMLDVDDEDIVAMSPVNTVTPRPNSAQRAAMSPVAPRIPDIPIYQHRHLSSLTNAVEDLNSDEIAHWTTRQVAQWMTNSGFEPSIVEKFKENDISGAILLTLKFEDLRELDIPSFGQRTKVWNEIHVLRDGPATSPVTTPIEGLNSPCDERAPRHSSRRREESRLRDGSRIREESTRRDTSRMRGESRRRDGSRMRDHSGECSPVEHPKRKESSRKNRKHGPMDIISPLESVSIVGIEQLMPKSHKCAKGENCSKWRKQQRKIEAFKRDHPVSPEGGSIWIAGNPGNPLTAPAIDLANIDIERPFSEAQPSVVASSDVMGPGVPVPAFRHLEEASLRNVQKRDAQENVKQFIHFQHMDPQQNTWTTSEIPATPPYEMFPNLPPRSASAQQPVAGLRGLPRLAIPPPPRQGSAPPPRSASAQAFSPYRMERVEAMAPDLRSATQSPATAVYRFGTPFSDMDIPVTAVPIGPVSRDASQSVPPNMSYRTNPTPPQRTQSRASARRPSFAMPRVDENLSTSPPSNSISPPRPTQAPHAHFIRDSHSVLTPINPSTSLPWSKPTLPDDVSHAGWMKKRKTKLLRHEWHEHHFTLRGTRLSMHKDARSLETLEYIDVDDYAIACSSLNSNSKLNAAFKAMNISLGNGKKEDDASAFSFQLIPAIVEKGVKLRKQAEKEGNGAKTKTHYFAVRSRDERIDWMRELMLAKALKQKSEGFEISVNGSLI